MVFFGVLSFPAFGVVAAAIAVFLGVPSFPAFGMVAAAIAGATGLELRAAIVVVASAAVVGVPSFPAFGVVAAAIAGATGLTWAVAVPAGVPLSDERVDVAFPFLRRSDTSVQGLAASTVSIGAL